MTDVDKSAVLTGRNPSATATRFDDHRSGRVLFVAHCLLNEHTRYLGGAGRGGAVTEIIQPCLDHGIGVVQLPCPEEQVWGGVRKRRLLAFIGSADTAGYRLRGVLLPLMLWWTRVRYRRLARAAASQIADHLRSGVKVLGVVGVDGSPTCGVTKTLHIETAFQQLCQVHSDADTANALNTIVAANIVAGRGMYLGLLRDELSRRGVMVPFLGHDLLGELAGRPSPVNVVTLLRSAPLSAADLQSPGASMSPGPRG